MYDTVRLRSPFIYDKNLYEYLKTFCVLRQGIVIKTNERLYEITSNELDGSYDSRIMFQLRNYDYDSIGRKVDCDPYIVLECSIPKLMNGHNVYMQEYSIKDLILFMITEIEAILNVKLPCFLFWEVLRVDVSQNFVLDSLEDVHDYILKYNLVSYPRRKVHKYSNTAIYFSGSTTTFKIYSKWDEYYKHDRKKVHSLLQYNKDKINVFEDYTKKILRFEVEVKKRKLQYDYNRSVFVYMLDDSYFVSLFNNEVDKVLKLVNSDLKVVNDFMNVNKRLDMMYSKQKSKLLFAFWNELTVLGYDEVRKKYPKVTFYRRIKDLKDAGISYNNTDVKIVDDKYSDFVPYYDSNYSIIYNKLAI